MKRRFHLAHVLTGTAMALALVAAQTIGAHAAVTDVATNGFTQSESADIAAPPDKVYAALIQPARWWSSDHTFSGSAANLSLDARAGGCWCETLPGGGGVQHLSVVSAMPGKSLRLVGMLGPFQAIAGNGVMTWTLTPANGGTHLEMTYQIAGTVAGGVSDVVFRGMSYADLAKASDGVLGEQVARLKRLIEIGSPETK